MTHEQRNALILKRIAEYTEKHTASPESARAALVREGLMRPAGRRKKVRIAVGS